MTASLEPYRRGRPLCPPGSDLKETLAYPNGDVVRWEYEPHRDLLTLVSNATHSAYRYTYDVAGRRVSKNDERYGYNVRGELVLATNVVDGTVFAYAYDDIGNRLWSFEFETNCTYAANELNQYTNIVRGSVAEHPAFDADGNQTDIVTGTGRWLVEYNGENRPVRWTRPTDGTVLEMSYDWLGRRISYGYDLVLYDGYKNITEGIWDPTEDVVMRVLASSTTGGLCLYFHDATKSIVNSVRSKEVKDYTYHPFGKIKNVTQEFFNAMNILYSSECYDAKLDTVYYILRTLNVKEGRWVQRDPGEEAFSSGLYLFVDNKPIDRTDFLGMDGCHTANSDFSVTKGFNFGVGQITVSYHTAVEQTQCVIPCSDCTKGYSIERNVTNGGGSGGSWQISVFGVPLDIGYSWTMSGGESYSYNSCSGTESTSKCNSLSISFFFRRSMLETRAVYNMVFEGKYVI